MLLILSRVFLPVFCAHFATADYPCVCSIEEDVNIFNTSDNSYVIGILNVTNCKAEYGDDNHGGLDYYAIQHNHQVGYVGAADLNRTICPGDIPANDTVYTTTTPSEKVTDSLLTTPAEIPVNTVVTSSVEWPSGTYGLMKPREGCPEGNWLEGWRKQDTEDFNPGNDFSPNIEHYLAGDFGRNVRTEFCMRTVSDTSGAQWPAGSYCILKKQNCPQGFQSGYIKWDDEDLFNANDFSGTLPDGEFNINTKIFYCCRDDGSISTTVYLPTSHPFVLLRYGSGCQAVQSMTVTDVFVRWDEDDWFTSSDYGGMHPLDEGADGNHKLHFCHYSSVQIDVSLVG